MKQKIQRIAAMGLASTLVAVAAPAVAKTQGVTAKQILLGTHLDLSGPVAAGMPFVQNGMTMRIDEANAKGGVNGRMIRLIVEDSGYRPAKAARAVQKLVLRDKVFAIVMPFGTGTSIAGYRVAGKAGSPHVFPWSGVAGPFHARKNPLSFTYIVNYDWGTAAGVGWAVKNLGAKKVGVLYQDDLFGKLVLKGVATGLAAHGQKIVAKAGFKPGSVDLSSQLANLRKAGVDLVILGTIVRETLGAYGGARKIGWKVNMMTTIPGRNQIITLIARKSKLSLDGLYGIGQWRIHGRNTKNKRAMAFIRTYMGKFKRPPTAESMVSYANMDWVIQGLTKAGRKLTAEGFANAMRSITYKDPFGNPDLRIGKGNHAGPQAVAIDQVKNGAWERISKPITGLK
jgi:ABC-type branched-subunit amino acid transport system substrate-binding protein